MTDVQCDFGYKGHDGIVGGARAQVATSNQWADLADSDSDSDSEDSSYRAWNSSFFNEEVRQVCERSGKEKQVVTHELQPVDDKQLKQSSCDKSLKKVNVLDQVSESSDQIWRRIDIFNTRACEEGLAWIQPEDYEQWKLDMERHTIALKMERAGNE